MVRVTPKTLRGILLGIQGSTIVTLCTCTEPRMRKTGNPYYGKVVKRSRYQAMLNFYYDEGVLRRLEKEGKSPDDFRKGESWHEPVLMEGRLTPLCWHKDEAKRGHGHLRIMYLKQLAKPVFVDVLTNKTIPEQRLAEWLYPASTYENQGLDNPLVFITPALTSVQEMKVGGKTYKVIVA